MMDGAVLTELRGLLGDAGVEEHDPVTVDSQEVSVTLRPADGRTLAQTLAVLRSSGRKAVIRGGGTRLGVGNSLKGADAIVSTERLDEVDVFEPAEGVCHVGAGTTLGALRSIVNAGGWELPLDPPGAQATVGGTIASAAVGPRAQAWGPTRDAVLGLELAHSGGERTRCGGRVVKNVTGYDLGKLYVGSFGSLAVIEAAWLRLCPLPERVLCFEVASGDLAAAFEAALGAARLGSARATSLRSPRAGGGEASIAVELAGNAAAVDADADWMVRRLEASPAPADAIDRVREHQGELPGAGGLRFRISALPSRTPALLTALHDAGAETLSYPGLRLVYAGFDQGLVADARAAEQVFACVAAAAGDAQGGWLCEAAPAWTKAGRDMHGDVAAVVPIFAALKQRFDPEQVLNPGRFAGGL